MRRKAQKAVPEAPDLEDDELPRRVSWCLRVPAGLGIGEPTPMTLL